MNYLTLLLALLAGVGIGMFLGEQYILYKQKKGFLLPVNPFSLPTIGDESTVRSVLEKEGIRVVNKAKETIKGAVLVGPEPHRLVDDEKAPRL